MAILNLIAVVTISSRCIADCPTVLVNPVPECDPDQGEICLTPTYPFAFSPSGGTYSTSQVVFVAINEPGLIVRYRLDDQEPGDTDPIFEPLQPLVIDRPTTITAKACSTILGGGLVQSTRYEFSVGDVVVDPSPGPVEFGTSVSLHSGPDKSIFISFAPPPVTLDTITDWVPYQLPIIITSNITVHFKATRPDYQPMLRTVSYTVARLPRPIFDPPRGPITNGTPVVITTATSNVTIRYTLDGSEPNELSSEYTAPLHLDGNSRLKARTYLSGVSPSYVRYTYYRSMSPNPQPYPTNSWDLPHLKLTYVTGADRPVWGTHAGDGTGRFFVVEETGNIRIVGNSTPFLQTELSLISAAFPPDYDSKAYLYVSYHAEGGRIAVARYSALANPDTADLNSQEVITNLPLTECRGGQLVFAPDGTLYLNSGGPIANAVLPEFNQDLNALSGKMIPILNENGAAFPASTDGICWPFEAYFSPTNCSIVGGVFARTTDTRLAGTYLYGNGNGRVWAITRGNGVWQNQFLARFEILTTVRRNTFQSASWEEMRPVDLSALGEDEDGHIYLSHYGTLVTNYHLQPPEIRHTLEGGGIYRLDDNLDVFSVRAVGGVNGHPLTLEWFSASGRSYQIQRSSNLQDWVDVLDPIAGTGGPLSTQVPSQSPASGHYYRVNLLPQ